MKKIEIKDINIKNPNKNKKKNSKQMDIQKEEKYKISKRKLNRPVGDIVAMLKKLVWRKWKKM